MKQEPIPDLEELWAVVYSVSDGNSKVETIMDNLKANRRAVRSNRATDYVPVFVTTSNEKAKKIAHLLGVEVSKNAKRATSRMLSIAEILDKIAPLSLMQRTDEPSK